MTQVSGMNVQSTAGNAVANLLAAIQAGLGSDGVQSKAFADLLSQAAAETQQPVNTNTVLTIVNASDASQPDPVAAPPVSDSSSDDNASLNTLVQRMKDDADALRADRRRANATNSQQNDADDQTQNASDQTMPDATVSTAMPVTSVAGGPTKLASNTTAATTSAAPTANKKTTVATDSNTTLQADVVMAVAQAIITASAQTTDGNKSVVATTAPETKTSSDDKNILADLINTEKAALLLLNKIAQGGAATATAAASDTADTTDSTPVTSVAGDLTAAVSAATDTTNAKGKNALTALLGAKTAIPQEQQDLQSLETAATPDTVLAADAETLSDPALLTSKEGTKNGASASDKTQTSANDLQDFLNLFNADNQIALPASTPGATGAILNALTARNTAASGDLSALDGMTTQAATHINATTQTSMAAETTRPAGSYDFASQLSAARATKGGATGLPTAVEQVALQLHKLVSDGQSQMTIQLRPAELGRIEVKLEFGTDNKVQGTVVADNPATLHLLSKDVGSLQRALQDAGLRADAGSLQFSLRGDGQQGSFASNTGDNSQSGAAQTASAALGNTDDTDTTTSDGVETYYLTPGRVNLRV
jgi:flagellar hook-length control protein FliK